MSGDPSNLTARYIWPVIVTINEGHMVQSRLNNSPQIELHWRDTAISRTEKQLLELNQRVAQFPPVPS